MNTHSLMRLYVLLLLVTIGFTSCKKEEDKIEDKFPSIEWYEYNIASGTWQCEKITDYSATYVGYTFYKNHSFHKYTKTADRVVTTYSDGSKKYSKWEIRKDQDEKGTWKITKEPFPELVYIFDNGGKGDVSLYNYHLDPLYLTFGTWRYEQEYDQHVGPTF